MRGHRAHAGSGRLAGVVPAERRSRGHGGGNQPLSPGDLDVSLPPEVSGPRLVRPEVGDLAKPVLMQQPCHLTGEKPADERLVHVAASPAKAAAAWIASRVRYIVTPTQEKTASCPESNPASSSPSRRVCRSKSTGANTSLAGSSTPSSSSRCRFHDWVAGWSTSKTRSRPSRSFRR